MIEKKKKILRKHTKFNFLMLILHILCSNAHPDNKENNDTDACHASHSLLNFKNMTYTKMLLFDAILDLSFNRPKHV